MLDRHRQLHHLARIAPATVRPTAPTTVRPNVSPWQPNLTIVSANEPRHDRSENTLTQFRWIAISTNSNSNPPQKTISPRFLSLIRVLVNPNWNAIQTCHQPPNWFMKYYCLLRLCLHIISGSFICKLILHIVHSWLTGFIWETTSPFCLKLERTSVFVRPKEFLIVATVGS